MTGTTSRIIHSGLLVDRRKESTTFRRLAYLSFFCADVSLRIFSRSSSASRSMLTRRSISLIASAPIWALNLLPQRSRSWRN
jgi:hypothetical protein